MGSIPGQGNKIPHAVWRDQKKKKGKIIKVPATQAFVMEDSQTYE